VGFRKDEDGQQWGKMGREAASILGVMGGVGTGPLRGRKNWGILPVRARREYVQTGVYSQDGNLSDFCRTDMKKRWKCLPSSNEDLRNERGLVREEGTRKVHQVSSMNKISTGGLGKGDQIEGRPQERWALTGGDKMNQYRQGMETKYKKKLPSS